MPRYISLMFCLLLVTSCAYVKDGSIKPLTIKTPGAHDAICYAYVNGFRYRFKPPQTMNVGKSKEDLIVECHAPGNRQRTVVIEPTLSDSAKQNIFTGVVPGMAWDSASGALYAYPDTVYVDFTNMPTSPEALPAQNNPDIRQPEEYDLEEFRSKQPRLNSDKYIQNSPIQERQVQEPIFQTYEQAAPPPEPTIEPISMGTLTGAIGPAESSKNDPNLLK